MKRSSGILMPISSLADTLTGAGDDGHLFIERFHLQPSIITFLPVKRILIYYVL